jgi:carotenoid cleavage dioxygenase
MGTPVNQVKVTLEPNDHPYRNGAWTPVFEELAADELEIIGEIPADIDGLYVRNTENPVHDSIGRYHPFDGDGMIHTIRLQNGKATYRNRFVRTEGFEAEQAEGGPLWVGIMGKPSDSKRPGWGAHGSVKDSSSTDVVVHAGAILSTFYQCGEGYRLDPQTLETLGTADWVPENGISAHPKVDEATGELLFFNYSTNAPYLHYGVVGPDNRLKHFIPIALPGPRLPHDMAFTEN